MILLVIIIQISTKLRNDKSVYVSSFELLISKNDYTKLYLTQDIYTIGKLTLRK